jgi:hypothetical protein
MAKCVSKAQEAADEAYARQLMEEDAMRADAYGRNDRGQQPDYSRLSYTPRLSSRRQGQGVRARSEGGAAVQEGQGGQSQEGRPRDELDHVVEQMKIAAECASFRAMWVVVKFQGSLADVNCTLGMDREQPARKRLSAGLTEQRPKRRNCSKDARQEVLPRAKRGRTGLICKPKTITRLFSLFALLLG